MIHHSKRTPSKQPAATPLGAAARVPGFARSVVSRLAAGALVFVGAVSIAGAQSAGTAGAAPAGPPDATAGLSTQVTLTSAEMVTQADASIARMESDRAMVRRMLEKARTQREAPQKAACLSDKLNQLDVALRSAKERKQSFDAAVGRSDLDLTAHEFTILGVLRQRHDQLVAEANQCVGIDVGVAGEAEIKVDVDPAIPDEDGYPANQGPAAATQVPSCVTCYK
jgi:hypothetical protein